MGRPTNPQPEPTPGPVADPRDLPPRIEMHDRGSIDQLYWPRFGTNACFAAPSIPNESLDQRRDAT
jgi:hypothetical protein